MAFSEKADHGRAPAGLAVAAPGRAPREAPREAQALFVLQVNDTAKEHLHSAHERQQHVFF